MPSASALRLQIESALAHKIPSALTPAARLIRPVAATGIATLDTALDGGLPIGAISELCGPECSGRTGAALSFLARHTQDKFSAWIDASNALDPLSAAAAGVNLSRMLWVRCGVENPQPRNSPTHEQLERNPNPAMQPEQPVAQRQQARQKSTSAWTPLEQALRACDLLLQAGGFSAIVLDMGSVAPEHASRIPLATWFRYRAAAERAQACILLLTQTSCAKSSAELLLRFQPATSITAEPTVFTGLEASVEVARRRFSSGKYVTPFRKPPQSARLPRWTSRATWAGHP